MPQLMNRTRPTATFSPLAMLLAVIASLVILPNATAASTPQIATAQKPITVSVHLPEPYEIVTSKSADREQWAVKLAAGPQRNQQAYPDRLIVLDLEGAPITGYLLSPEDKNRIRELIQDTITVPDEQEPRAVADADVVALYEHLLADLLHRIVDRTVSTSGAGAVSILGLPLEPRGMSPRMAQGVNQRFAGVLDSLDAFTSAQSFILMNSSMDELTIARNKLQEAFRLHNGRPLIFRTNGTWRIAMFDRENDPTAEAFVKQFEDSEDLIVVDARESARSAGDAELQLPAKDAGPAPQESGVGDTSYDDTGSGGGSGGSSFGSGVVSSGTGLRSGGGGGSGGSGGGGGGGTNWDGSGEVDPDAPNPLSPRGGPTGNSPKGNNPDGDPDDDQPEVDQPEDDNGVEDPNDNDNDNDNDNNNDNDNDENNDNDNDNGNDNPGGGWTPGTCDDEEDWDPWANTHDFTGLPMTCDGWTDFTAMYQHPQRYQNSRIIYVSSSTGQDTSGVTYTPGHSAIGEDPFNPAGNVAAYRTVQAALNQARNGFPDIILFKRGDTWEDRIGTWTKSGPAPTEPIIIATYGESAERSTLLIGSNNGINAGSVDNLIVSGLRFYSHTWETESPGKGYNVLSYGNAQGSRNQLYEDCVFERNSGNNRFQANDNSFHENLAVRRCHFISNHNQSVYANFVHDLLFEENVFFGSEDNEIDRRFLYLSPAGNENNNALTGAIVRGNIFMQGSDTGLSLRSGGIIENNLIVRNDQMLVGGAGGSKDSIQSATIRNNVFTQSSVGAGDGEIGIKLQNIDGGDIRGNIWVDPANLGVSSYAMMIKGDVNVHVAKNIDIRQNIVYGWGGSGFGRSLRINVEFQEVENVTIRDNDFQMVNGSGKIVQHGSTAGFDGFTYLNNRYFSTASESSWFFQGGVSAWSSASGEINAVGGQVAYPNPERDLKTYNESLGGAPSVEEFIQIVLEQSRGDWNPNYTAVAVNAYIREGFGLPPGGIN